MNNRRRLLLNQGGGRLPAEYQEVEYIGSNGSQNVRIETGVSWNSVNKIILKLKTFINNFNDQILLSSYYVYSHEKNSPYIQISGTNGFSNFASNPTLTNLNNLEPATFTWTFSSSSGSPICTKFWDAGYYSRKVQYYFIEFYYNDNIIMNLIPCYRKTDNKIGMYDLVQNRFIESFGNTEFYKGADV